MIPATLFIPIGDALRSWRAVVCAPHMPTPDEEAAVGAMVWAISYRDCADSTVWELVNSMTYEDALYENAFLTEQDRDSIFRATFELCRAIAETLVQVNAYRDGVFPYELERLLPDDTLVLRRVSGGTDGAQFPGNP